MPYMRYDFSHIDFAPLSKIQNYKSKVWKFFGLWVLVVTIVIVTIAAITGEWFILIAIIHISIFSVVVFAIIDAIKSAPTNKANSALINEFFKINKFHVDGVQQPASSNIFLSRQRLSRQFDSNITLPDNLYFQKGNHRSQKITQLIDYKNHVAQGEFYYETTSRDSDGDSHTVPHRETFFRFQLSRRAPNIIVDSANLVYSPSGAAQKIKTESPEFDKKFKVYIPKGYHIDALQIFTPDVMACLLDYGAAYDYELIDNYCYIYMPRLDYAKLLDTLATLSRIATQFDQQAKHYSDARVGHFDADKVHIDGARIGKPAVNKIAVIIVLSVLALLFMSFVAAQIFFATSHFKSQQESLEETIKVNKSIEVDRESYYQAF